MRRLMIQETGAPTTDSRAHPSYEQLSSTLDAIPDLMFELDQNGMHLDYRVLRPELLVAPPQQLLGHTVSEVMPTEAAEAVMNALAETQLRGYSQGTQILLPTPSGDRWFEISIARKDKSANGEMRFIALSRDITERKQQQIQTERLAYIDGLTELPNRHALIERLMTEIQKKDLEGQFGALLFLDLDNFKILNDSKGHSMGDMLLKIVAQRLRASVRDNDLVIRWGGDEFVILICNLADNRYDAEQHAAQICDQIAEKIAQPYDLDHCLHSCQVSIGANIFENLGANIEEIIRDADNAMYKAKKSKDLRYAVHKA